MVHRDVSPRNILVGRDGICRLTDFGIVRARGRLTETPAGVIKGTLGYVPPESILGRPLDHRGDLYSVGIILWELLAGRRLFARTAEYSLRSDPRLLAGPLEDPSRFNADLPAPLVEVCMKSLEYAPARRFQSASAMVSALEEAMAQSELREVGPRLTGRLVTALERMRRRAPRA